VIVNSVAKSVKLKKISIFKHCSKLTLVKALYYQLIIIVISLMISSGSKAQPAVEQYISKYNKLAVSLMDEYCIPASIILSVAAMESAACSSRNCKLLNNHFGIKSAKKYRIPGTKHITAYKKYDSDTASYRDFCNWIVRRKFYDQVSNTLNYSQWATAISKSGYTRAPSAWKKKILLLIQKYKLDQYDLVSDPLLRNQ